MVKHLKYLRYLLRHKFFVLVAGLRCSAPLWRLLIHDWSKFMPQEWFAYVEQFYGDGPRLKKMAVTTLVGLLHSQRQRLSEVNQAFDYAWLHHQHLNPHHWQHWVLREDSGAHKCLSIPQHFLREMVADWAGAGRAITGQWEVLEWYDKNQRNIQLTPLDRVFVEQLLCQQFRRKDAAVTTK